VQGIIKNKIGCSKKGEELSKACDLERGIFEQIYYKAVITTQEIVLQKQIGAKVHAAAEDHRENREKTPEMTCRRPKLPEIKLPDFDGDYIK